MLNLAIISAMVLENKSYGLHSILIMKSDILKQHIYNFNDRMTGFENKRNTNNNHLLFLLFMLLFLFKTQMLILS